MKETQNYGELRQQRIMGNDYIVEFPPEDYEEQHHPLLKLDVEEENKLAIQVSHILSIKRPRSEEWEDPINDGNMSSGRLVNKTKY